MKKLIRFTVIGLTLGVAGLLLARRVVDALSPPPGNLGVVDGRLAPCPDTPNCVSSQAADLEQKIPPIHYTTDTDEAHAMLMAILRSQPRMQVIVEQPDYIYVIFRSATFQFIDDAEFYFDETETLIHVRSAARLGYSDLEVNRNRIREISDAFHASSRWLDRSDAA